MKFLKQYILILISIALFSSCSSDNDNSANYYFEYVPVTTVDVPLEFVFGETYQIRINYELPSECHDFYDFDYIYDDTSRKIYTIAIVSDDLTCMQATTEGEHTISIHVRQSEPYVFEFWQGDDNQGVHQYLIIEVPVI